MGRAAGAVRGLVETVARRFREFEPPSRPRPGRTIHFARWVIVDDDRKLLFTSNFDGAWDTDLRDFTELIPDLLDGVWANCEAYPGARRYEEFIAWVRAHQVTTDLFYASFPEVTVRDIKYLRELKGSYERFERAVERSDRSCWPDDSKKAVEELKPGARSDRLEGARVNHSCSQNSLDLDDLLLKATLRRSE